MSEITYVTEPCRRGEVQFTILAQFIQLVDDGS